MSEQNNTNDNYLEIPASNKFSQQYKGIEIIEQLKEGQKHERQKKIEEIRQRWEGLQSHQTIAPPVERKNTGIWTRTLSLGNSINKKYTSKQADPKPLIITTEVPPPPGGDTATTTATTTTTTTTTMLNPTDLPDKRTNSMKRSGKPTNIIKLMPRAMDDIVIKSPHRKDLDLSDKVVDQQTKMKEMEEELNRLRKMKEELEVQHINYQKRLELKIQEEVNQKKSIEEELNMTRSRLKEELENIKQTKEELSQQIDSLKNESQKKALLENELETIRVTKESLDKEIEKLKTEAQRKATLENEIEQIKLVKQSLESEMTSLKAETFKKKELEEELVKVKETKERLLKEIDGLKVEEERRKEIETEMEKIRKSKEEMESEISSLKEESQRRKELEEKLHDLQKSNDKYLLEMKQLQEDETETRTKLESELNQLKTTTESLHSEMDILRQETEKAKQLEEELERLRLHSHKLSSEVVILHSETEKRKALEIELEKLQLVKDKLNKEMEFLKEEQIKRQKLEEELVEVKEIKERLASELNTLKVQDTEEKQKAQVAEQQAILAALKAKEEAEALEEKVKKQQQTIIKLKEKNQRLSANKSKLVQASLNIPGSNQESKLEFYQRMGPINFKTACVTGVDESFLAYELIRTLRANNVDVVAFASPGSDVDVIHKIGAVTARGSFSNVHELLSAMNGCEVVFYCTSETPLLPEQEYINRAMNAISAAKKVNCKRLVILSTAEVILGNVTNYTKIVDETLPIRADRMNGLYGRAMAKVEQLALERCAPVTAENGDGLEVVIVRPPWVWGIGDPRMKRIIDSVRGKSFTWINSGSYLYSYCNVSNLIEGMIMAAQYGENGEIYFLTDSCPMQFKEFVTRLLATQNLDCSHIKSVSTWLGNAVSWFQSMISIEKMLNWVFTYGGLLGTSGVSLSYSDIAISSALNQILLVSDKKARSKLGYKGYVGLEKGLEEMREHFILQLKTPRSTLQNLFNK